MKNGILAILANKPLIAALGAQLSAQVLKIFLPLLRGGRPSLKEFLHYGGFPSAHTAFIVGLTFSVAFNEGWDSSLFAICAVLSGIIIYDIIKLRTAVEIAVELSGKLASKAGIEPGQRFPQLKGHRLGEVIAGLLWGLAAALIVQGLPAWHAL
jgi:hypothetical protein